MGFFIFFGEIMRFLLKTILILTFCTSGSAWGMNTITQDEYNRRVDLAFAKIQAERLTRVDLAFASIRAARQSDPQQAPKEPERPVLMTKSSDNGLESSPNETNTDGGSSKKVIFYRSPNDRMRINSFFTKGAGLSLQLRW